MLRHDTHAQNVHLHHDSLSVLNIVMFLRAFGVSLTGLFIPALLFDLGHSFFDVMMFYFIYQVFVVPLQWVTLKLVAKFGIETTIMLSAIPAAISFIVLMLMQYQFIWILCLALLHALADILFWIPYHFDYLFATSKKHTGKASGVLLAMQVTGSTIGPVIGGAIITFWSKDVLLLIAVALSLAYAIPLFTHKVNRKVRVKYAIKKDCNGFAFYCEGISRGAFSMVWPVYLIVSGVTVFALGILYTGARMGVAAASAIFGAFSDHHKSQKLFDGFTLATSATYVSRLFVSTPLSIGILTVFGEVLFTLMNVPFTKRWLDLAKRDGPQVLISREILVCLGRISVVALVMIIGIYSVSMACIVGLLAGSMATLGFLFIENVDSN